MAAMLLKLFYQISSNIHNPCPCGLFHFCESMSHCSHEILGARETVRNCSNIHIEFPHIISDLFLAVLEAFVINLKLYTGTVHFLDLSFQ